ncbi:MAG: hypothetical protein OIF35_07365 [Cellvibrionaceae bacterium]|nr:hypothetical protein [Cellvibrionaceae bacterium]MCV6624821.1 hypothetical protein [Cellvibrionaceae bacterium]
MADTDRDHQLLEQLDRQHSPFFSLLAAVGVTSACIAGLALLRGQHTPLLLLILPSIIAAIVIRVIGRPYSSRDRLLPSLLVGLISGWGVVLMGGSINNGLFVTGISGVLCALVCKRSLSVEQSATLAHHPW